MSKKTKSRSITFKMSFYMTLLIIFLMAAVGFGNYYNTMLTVRSQALDKGWSIVRSSSAFTAEHLYIGNQDLLPEHLENIRANEDVSYAAIINAAGKIVAHTDQNQVGKTAPFAGDPPTQQIVRVYNDAAGKPAGNDFISPIYTKGGTIMGYFQLGLDSSRHEAMLRDVIMKTLLISIAAVLACIMLARVMAVRILKEPISDLMEATEHIAAGNFSHQVPVRKMDELGSLAAAFNTMTGHLANLFMSVRISANELTRSSQVILNRSEEFRMAAENVRRAKAAGEDEITVETGFIEKKQLEAIEEMTASAKRMARLVDRLNALALQFKL
ncbi:MAG: HAMP domain-containing protein [Peptococcaceae bacterium]|nr:HAMP domain-containing protein [Peptococcaceae bacterium]